MQYIIFTSVLILIDTMCTVYMDCTHTLTHTYAKVGIRFIRHVFQCIVQSYLLWLHDNDYNPVCTLCSGQLSDGDCVRLTCYHMYHWACLDQYARSLPATTAPAGYICPVCRICIFPQAKLVSPVADVLREKLAAVNWARAGLGLPLVCISHSDATLLQ